MKLGSVVKSAGTGVRTIQVQIRPQILTSCVTLDKSPILFISVASTIKWE